MNNFDTRHIEPKWDSIFVSRHAIDQYQSRVVEARSYTKVENIVRKIKEAILFGRRSDREPILLMELEPWLKLVKWTHKGRPVSLWMDNRRLCCLVVRDGNKPDGLVVLTCFKAVLKSRV